MEAMGEEDDLCVCCLAGEEEDGVGVWWCLYAAGGHKGWAGEAGGLTAGKLQAQPHHDPAWELGEITSVLGVSSPAELAVSLCKVKAAGSASSGFRGNPR